MAPFILKLHMFLIKSIFKGLALMLSKILQISTKAIEYSLIIGLVLCSCICDTSTLYAFSISEQSFIDLSGLSSSNPLHVYYAVNGKIKDTRIIIVDKSENRMLVLRCKDQMYLEYEFQITTGSTSGRKEIEGDEKTPEGIYFSTHRYLDTKVTIFGDRAIGLNYPNPIDILERRSGSGIYIHGTNQKQLRSSKGCITLKNDDMAIIDPIIMEQSTPIIIVNRFLSPLDISETKATDVISTITVQDIIKHPNVLAPVILLKTTEDITYDNQLNDVFKNIEDDISSKEEGRILIGLGKQWVMILFYKIQNENPLFSYDYIRRFYLSEEHDKKLSMIQNQLIVSDSKELQRLLSFLYYKKEEKLISSILDSWLTAWQNKTIDDYIFQYSEGFSSYGKNLKEWRKSKEKLFKTYEVIRVNLSNVVMKITKDSATVTFLQDYASDMYRDTGYKTLHLIKIDDKWRINEELWEALK